ncbi:hypothetical protein TUA1478L_02110 [Lactiplantibacillus plantarum]
MIMASRRLLLTVHWISKRLTNGSKNYGGDYTLLYVAPERLDSDYFIQALGRLPIQLLAIDEAHCISQWGTIFVPVI